MKKYLTIISGLLLASPLALAQAPPPPSTPDTPSLPADPAKPATPDPAKDPTKDKKAPKSPSGSVSGKGDFAAFDANGDGSLTQDEVKADASIKFKDLDKNSDGKISRGEYESSTKPAKDATKDKVQ